MNKKKIPKTITNDNQNKSRAVYRENLSSSALLRLKIIIEKVIQPFCSKKTMNLPNVNPITSHLSKGSIIEFVVKIELGGSVPHLIKIEHKREGFFTPLQIFAANNWNQAFQTQNNVIYVVLRRFHRLDEFLFWKTLATLEPLLRFSAMGKILSVYY